MTTPTREQALQWAREADVMIGSEEAFSIPVGRGMPDRLVNLAALAYSAGAVSASDCWTCKHREGVDYCNSVAQCIDRDQYKPIRLLKMWRKE